MVGGMNKWVMAHGVRQKSVTSTHDFKYRLSQITLLRCIIARILNLPTTFSNIH